MIIAKLTLACRIHAITVELVLLEEVLIYVNAHQVKVKTQFFHFKIELLELNLDLEKVTKAKLAVGQNVNPVIYVKIRAPAKPSIPVMVSYAIA